MSFTALLQHVCDIEARSVTEDVMGQPENEYVSAATNVPCRLIHPSENESRSTRSVEDYRLNYGLLLLPDVEIRESDRIAEVRDAAGTVIAREIDIEKISPVSDGRGITHHLQLSGSVKRESVLWT